MTVQTVLVTGTFDDGSKNPITNGRVSFQLSQTATATGLVLGDSPIRCILNTSGQMVGLGNTIGTPLVPNDVISPTGTFYVVTASLSGGVTKYFTITVLSSMAPTVDLSALTWGQVPNGWTP